jgi:hypothetical protein
LAGHQVNPTGEWTKWLLVYVSSTRLPQYLHMPSIDLVELDGVGGGTSGSLPTSSLRHGIYRFHRKT